MPSALPPRPRRGFAGHAQYHSPPWPLLARGSLSPAPCRAMMPHPGLIAAVGASSINANDLDADSSSRAGGGSLEDSVVLQRRKRGGALSAPGRTGADPFRAWATKSISPLADLCQRTCAPHASAAAELITPIRKKSARRWMTMRRRWTRSCPIRSVSSRACGCRSTERALAASFARVKLANARQRFG